MAHAKSRGMTAYRYRFALFLLLPLALWVAMLVNGGLGSALDEGLYALFYGGEQPGLIAPARLLTALGGWIVLVPVSLAAALYLFVQHRRREAILLLAITLGGRLAVALQKDVIARERPLLSEHLVTTSSMSFPSGHAANSMIVWLTLALLLPRGSRPSLVATAIALSTLIGLSRVALGVHWPSDVAGGWAFGLAWTLGFFALARPQGTPDRLRH